MTNDEIKDISPKLRKKIVDLIIAGVRKSTDCPIQQMSILFNIMDGFDVADPSPDPEPAPQEEANLDG